MGNIVCSAVCAAFVATGLSHSGDFSDPQNWPIWAGLVGLSALGVIGTGANAARLWWKKWRIKRSPGKQLTVILAHLVGDDSGRGQQSWLALSGQVSAVNEWNLCRLPLWAGVFGVARREGVARP